MAGMDDVPREILQTAYQRKPLYVLKVPFLYGIWFAAGWAIYATRDSSWAIPVGLAGSLMITLLMRGVGAVAHDAVHGTVVKNKTAAYWIGLICWAPTATTTCIITASRTRTPTSTTSWSPTTRRTRRSRSC